MLIALCDDESFENDNLYKLINDYAIRYDYFEDKNSEIDFVTQNGAEIIPVEVKGGKDNSNVSGDEEIKLKDAAARCFVNIPRPAVKNQFYTSVIILRIWWRNEIILHV